MNIFDLPKLPLLEEETMALLENSKLRVERIVSTGQISNWYDQGESELVILLEGQAEIEFDNGGVKSLKKGDTLLIKPHEIHRVSYTSREPACIWLCIFFR
jgi:cupin 2 domain-containing protein